MPLKVPMMSLGVWPTAAVGNSRHWPNRNATYGRRFMVSNASQGEMRGKQGGLMTTLEVVKSSRAFAASIFLCQHDGDDPLGDSGIGGIR